MVTMYDIYMITEQTPSAVGDHNKQLKAPKEAGKWNLNYVCFFHPNYSVRHFYELWWVLTKLNSDRWFNFNLKKAPEHI